MRRTTLEEMPSGGMRRAILEEMHNGGRGCPALGCEDLYCKRYTTVGGGLNVLMRRTMLEEMHIC